MNLRSKRRTTSGNILAITVVTLAVVSLFLGLAVEYTNNIGRNVQRSISLRQAINIADASTEMSFAAWRSIARAKGSTVLKKADMDNELPTPAPSHFPGVANYSLSNYTVYPLNSQWVARTAASATPARIAGPQENDFSYYFLASADVVIPTVTSKNATSKTDRGNIVAKVRRIFQKETLSLWRYAVFFNDDLEIHPGAEMKVNGEVHTNGTMYTAHKQLTLNGKTTYTDNWSLNYHPQDPRYKPPQTPPTPTPTPPKWSANLAPAADLAQQAYGVDLTDYHELIENKSTTAALDPYRFETQADVRVYIDGSNNLKIYNSSNVEITNLTGTSNDAKVATAFKAAITKNEFITDNREGAASGNGSIRLATLNVGQISSAMNAGTISLAKRVIYIIDTSALNADGTPNPAAKRAIRLKNGAQLPDGGLTIASGNPVYVQGDYNTGTSGGTQPPSNLQPLPSPGATPPSSTVAGYDRQPAAIIGDAVNILSNAWLDSNSGNGAMPPATPTTVNAGIISGNVATNGTYSGGVENFPRFLENWSGKVFTYYGSMIQLYKSKQAVGLWGPGYSPPQRSWFFDTNFITNPPPGTLNSVNYRRSRWYML